MERVESRIGVVVVIVAVVCLRRNTSRVRVRPFVTAFVAFVVELDATGRSVVGNRYKSKVNK